MFSGNHSESVPDRLYGSDLSNHIYSYTQVTTTSSISLHKLLQNKLSMKLGLVRTSEYPYSTSNMRNLGLYLLKAHSELYLYNLKNKISFEVLLLKGNIETFD